MVYNSLQISKILEISYEPLNMPIPRGNIYQKGGATYGESKKVH
nr:MAG TPA: hypothetical protein [Caudoviricetes sp.]